MAERTGPAGPGTPAIRLTSLRKEFAGTPPVVAVDDVDLDVRAGEFFSMLGPSGSGKTTVLRMIAGFEEPTSGRIELAGADVTKRQPFDRDVNTVFQDYALFPHMSVAENVEYGLLVKKVSRAERRTRVAEALEQVRLGDHGKRKPSQLSGGQRQRVALARALVNRPTVLLLDEPLGALDLKLREQMQVELKGIQRDVGITFLFVTHDQEEALTLSDRVAVFHAGRIEQVGTAREVYESPASAFVAGFVGTSNLLAGDAARAVIGREGSFAIRPEKLLIAPAGDTQRGDGLMGAEAVLEEVVYGGPITRYVVALDAGARLTALEQNTGASHAAANLRRGERVRIQWNPEHVIDVPESASR
ncbi:ABC transporter ATP-binding protein [Humibacillus xanthopallidus]|uniref:Putative spermidine/putrescine transport system ATP-binding protein n=1 Tax=Humibacillus xanthopallidus TaxID=412689 RepID=A0A543HVA2_9MICO|nr:ABC transporter ATP-binding protein [Humibacillus xanthopallidus]TQM62169.1 putative spermidine/putrescine transport system ATP-binding protein [Humibacillus xanthopallidus]